MNDSHEWSEKNSSTLSADQPIIVSYEWSSEDYVQSRQFAFRHHVRPAIRFGMLFLAGLLVIGGGIGMIALRDRPRNMALVCTMFGLVLFSMPSARRRRYLREYECRPDKGLEITWTIRPDKISQHTSRAHSEATWEPIVKIVETPSGFLFYSLENFSHWLPRRGFASDTEFDRLRDLAKTKVQRFYWVN